MTLPRLVNVAEINPHAPRPYTFTEAALCLRDSIRAAGYASDVQVNKVDINQRCLVLGALPPHLGAVEQLDRRKAAIVNFEQLAGKPQVTGESYVPWLRQWLVADYHQQNIAWLRQVHGPAQQAIELPLVPSESLHWRQDLVEPPSVDVLFFGTPNERRSALLQQLEAAGLKVEVVAGAYADELAPAIRRARLVLHVHFYATGLFPVVRFLQPVVQGVPIVCEDSVFSLANDWSRSAIVFAPYEGLVEACRTLLADPAQCAARAARNREFGAAIDFATPFAHLLELLERMDYVPQGPPPGVAPPAPIAPPVARELPARAQPPAGMAPPAPIRPPLGGGTSAARVTAQEDSDRPLTDEEIEEILARENAGLPPEAAMTPQPLKVVERQPGQGKFGVWVVWLLILFSCYTIWATMRW